MIDHPRTVIRVETNSQFALGSGGLSSETSRDRIEAIAGRIAQHFQLDQWPRCRVTVEQQPDSHHGLGSGTQLALAVTDGILRCIGLSAEDPVLALKLAARGRRSAVGIHGYFRGGMIFEDRDAEVTELASSAGQASSAELAGLNPLRKRLEIPDAWRVVLFRPRDVVATVSGDVESEKFECSHRDDSEIANHLTSTFESRIAPAVRSSRFDEFASAVEDFNRESGSLFASVQGGPYNGPAISELVAELQASGAVGVGQSSWGPTVFAWFASQAEADAFLASHRVRFPIHQVVQSLSTGRQVTCLAPTR